LRKIATTGVLLGILAALTLGHVKAHDHNHPELEGWFKSLHSKGGAWCCNGDDAEEVEWDTSEGKYRVRVEGQWINVPNDAVVEGENKVGGARVWLYYTNGRPNVRCFLPGDLS